MNINKVIVIFVFLFLFVVGVSSVKAQDQIERKELGVAQLGTAEINKVDAREITFKPLQKTGLHLHPGAVVGYVVAGEILFQVEGQKSKLLHAGDSFYEPANAKIVRFDNNSKKRTARFVAFYLLKDGQELIKMLAQ